MNFPRVDSRRSFSGGGCLFNLMSMYKLYTKEKKMLDFTDYGVILDHAKGCRTALEFGPGISTLALVEAGCKVTTCEYQEMWFDLAKKKYPDLTVLLYENKPEVSIPEIDHLRFDIAFVDSPIGSVKCGWKKLPGQEELARFNTVVYACLHADKVLLHDAKRHGEQNTLNAMRKMGYSVEMIDTKKGIAVIC